MAAIRFLPMLLLIFYPCYCSTVMAAASLKTCCEQLDNSTVVDSFIPVLDYVFHRRINISKRITLPDCSIAAKDHVAYCCESPTGETIELIAALKRACGLRLSSALERMKDYCNEMLGEEIIDYFYVRRSDDGELYINYHFPPGHESKLTTLDSSKFITKKTCMAILKEIKSAEADVERFKSLHLPQICHAKIGEYKSVFHTLVLVYCFTNDKNDHATRKMDIELSDDIYNNLWNYVGLSAQD